MDQHTKPYRQQQYSLRAVTQAALWVWWPWVRTVQDPIPSVGRFTSGNWPMDCFLSSRTFSAQRAYHRFPVLTLHVRKNRIASLVWHHVLCHTPSHAVPFHLQDRQSTYASTARTQPKDSKAFSMSRTTWKFRKVCIKLSCFVLPKIYPSICLLSHARSNLISHMAMSCCKDSCLACAK